MKRTIHTLLVALMTLCAVTAATAASVGVTVNGVMLDDTVPDGDGWTYASDTLTLTNAGPFTLSGTNELGQIRVVVQQGVTCDVTLSNLTLQATSYGQCAFTLETGAGVSLFLAGENALASGENRAGLEVAEGRTLSITNAPGDDAGALTVTGGKYGAGIGGNKNNACGTVTINGGQVFAYVSGIYGAGIGGGYYGAGGAVTINGGVVTATGGSNGAGIGGGYSGVGGTVTINGGTVTAAGGSYAAGIGGGRSGAGGSVTIAAGRVTATGGSNGAGIGGGAYSSGVDGTVTISGGTVAATGTNGAKDIGPGQSGTVSGANTFTGGSIRLGTSSAFHAPSNNTEQVFCATVSGFAPDDAIEFSSLGNLPGYYGTTSIYADNNGIIYLWLPDSNTYTFTANGRECTVKIQNGNGPTGVTVNGEEIAYGPADPGSAGWSFDTASRVVSLSGAGPFTLAGVNTIGGVSFAVPDNTVNAVTLSNLTLRAAGNNQCAFALGTGANVSLALAGTNSLASGLYCPGILVESGRTLSITNAPGDDTASLTATGGGTGAGIGGGQKKVGGAVNISGGAVTAVGGACGAGIGGGGSYGDRGSKGGTVTINGGTVTARAGSYAAGIGGGGGSYNSNGGDGGTLTVNGGDVTATGGNEGAGIGGGNGSSGGTVTISGGTVTATGGDQGAGIGSGINRGGVPSGGKVTINGGQVAAMGINGGAGIGGGKGASAATVKIAGGTIFAQGADGNDIGKGANYGTGGGSNIFTGGTISLANASIYPNPTDGTERVWCGKVWGFAPYVAVTITGLDPYGVNDLFADAEGIIHLWLPNGSYTFTANGTPYTLRVKDGLDPLGVTVNGEEVLYGPETSTGWSYNTTNRTVSLFGTGPFTVAGTNETDGVGIVVPAGVTNAVTLSNLTLLATGENQCAFALGTNACVSLFLAGTNTLASGVNRAGIEVAAGALSITNAPGDEAGALSAAGGDYGAGIGGGDNENGIYGDVGTVTISGGDVTATGGSRATGIGGGYNGDGGTVTVNGGTVVAAGGQWGAGIGGGDDGDGGTVTVNGGTVAATGGDDAAGIGGGDYGSGGTVTINGGTVTATGIDQGAGIGGGNNGSGGIVSIAGGTVAAIGGETGGAGIGGGRFGAGGTVDITGGHVTVTGYSGGTGIGGGDDGAGAAVTVAGGTVFARGNDAADIGPGGDGTLMGTNTFIGGSIYLTGAFVAPAPSNNAEQVFCATLTGFDPGKQVVLDGLPGYGVDDIYADGYGIIYLWLPNGTYTFTANGDPRTVTIQNGTGPTGVTVNGEEAAYGPSDPLNAGWSFDTTSRTAMLSGPGPFVLSGVNVIGGVGIAVTNGVTSTVTLSNLTLKATGDYQCAFALGTNAVVSLALAGTNTLVSGKNRAGLEVATGQTLSIIDAFGHEGALTVTGGYGGAGIGGGYDANGGAVTVNGGALTATGGYGAAGVGGGYNYSNIPNADTDSGGTVTINGGTVSATGGYGGAGIGGGAFGGGGTVAISGGTVVAAGGGASAGIGGGYDANGGAVTVNGGAITATGGYAGAGIGGGYNYSNIPNAETDSGGTVTIIDGAVTATGGSYGAGVGGGAFGGGGTVAVTGGTVMATGGEDGAGIGGGYMCQGSILTISGGEILATGGNYAAGIGGGSIYNSTAATAGAGGTVAISGGRVAAIGGAYAAGLGGGSGWNVKGGNSAVLTVVGGTVFATGGAEGGPGVGSGVGNVANGGTAPHISGSCTFTGGSIRIDGGYAATDPTDGANRVWCVTVPGITPGAAVTVASLGAYGVNDLVADENGRLYLWLPDNVYTFTAGGFGYTVAVNGADATATLCLAAPVFAADGSGIVVSGTTLSITITNVQGGIWYTLYAVDTLGGTWDWQQVQSVCALDDSDLTFENVSATPTKRFFKVVASESQP